MSYHLSRKRVLIIAAVVYILLSVIIVVVVITTQRQVEDIVQDTDDSSTEDNQPNQQDKYPANTDNSEEQVVLFDNYTNSDASDLIVSQYPGLAYNNAADFDIISTKKPLDEWAILSLYPKRDNIDSVVVIVILHKLDTGVTIESEPFPVVAMDYYIETLSLPTEVEQTLREIASS